MPSRKLTPDEAKIADAILERVKADIAQAARDDPVLLFALKRRTWKYLSYWERGTPAHRRKIQTAKWTEQNGLCAICREPVDQHGAEMDRRDPVLGYTVQNVRVVHHACHVADQKAKHYQ